VNRNGQSAYNEKTVSDKVPQNNRQVTYQKHAKEEIARDLGASTPDNFFNAY
jgi:hypothetical protein